MDVDQEITEHVRQMGGLLPLTDEQSEALGAAVLLLAQGDSAAQLDFPQQTYHSSNNGDRHTTTYGGMYA